MAISHNSPSEELYISVFPHKFELEIMLRKPGVV